MNFCKLGLRFGKSLTCHHVLQLTLRSARCSTSPQQVEIVDFGLVQPSCYPVGRITRLARPSVSTSIPSWRFDWKS